MKIKCAWMLCKYNSSNTYGEKGDCNAEIDYDYLELSTFKNEIINNVKCDKLYCNAFKLDDNKLNINNLNQSKIYSLTNLLANLKIGQKAIPACEDKYLVKMSKHTCQLNIYREEGGIYLNDKTLTLYPELLELDWVIIPDYNDGTWVK